MSATTNPHTASSTGAASAVSSPGARDAIAWRLIGAPHDGRIGLGDGFEGELWTPPTGSSWPAIVGVDIEGGTEDGDLMSFELRARDAETRFIDSPVVAVSRYEYRGAQLAVASWNDDSVTEREWQAEVLLYEPVSPDITLEEMTARIRDRLHAPDYVASTVDDAVTDGEGGYFPQDNGVAVAVEAR